MGEPWFYTVGIDCPEEYAVYVCNDIADSCQTYCDDIAVWLEEVVEPEYVCYCNNDLPGEGCWPHTEDIGVEEVCVCDCYGW